MTNIYTNLGTVATATVKASKGAKVFGFTVRNDNAAVRYFQLHNLAAALAGTEVPVLTFAIPGGLNAQILVGTEFFTESGYEFSTGLTWGVSTTANTFTAATAAEHSVMISWT